MKSRNRIRLRIDRAGRIFVPKPLRERLGLKPGTDLEAVAQRGRLLLRAMEERPAMIKVDGLWVHQGVAEPRARWDRVLENVREKKDRLDP